jgi:DNA polymerase elongation subunit (family B)/predicted RNA-binding Zn-ribbon protein involved in translation (DUF1610 family)
MERRIKIKILLLDIETAPNLVHVWGLWQQNVGINQIMDSGYVMSWAAKWVGEPNIYFESLKTTSKRRMVKKIHTLLEQADVVVHYNGTKFDIPTLNQEFVMQGLHPPSPFKQVDLLSVVKSRFRFPSNKLEYVVKALKVGTKLKNSGHELWVRCMAGEAEAWEEMREYNIHDTVLLEGLFNKLRPWIKSIPNHSLYDSVGGFSCPVCTSTHLQRRGYTRTAVSKFARFQCQDCGSWSRSGVNEVTTEERKTLLRPA